VADASGFGNYIAECWQPSECDKFALGGFRGAPVFGPAPVIPGERSHKTPLLLDLLWHRAGWIQRQEQPGLSGARGTSLFKPQGAPGPSIASLCGSWRDELPVGNYASRVEFVQSRFGERLQWTDGDGDEWQALRFGAMYRAPYDFSDNDGDVYAWDASTTPAAGTVAGGVTGWLTRTGQLGESVPAMLARHPYRATGGTRIAQWNVVAGALCTVSDMDTDSDATLPGISFAAVDEDLETWVRGLFE
jgi:hypothetical protein